MKHGCNQMKIFQRDYFGMKRIFTKGTGYFLLGRVDNVVIWICYTDKYSNPYRHELNGFVFFIGTRMRRIKR
ncbi:hypothetical protein DW888_18675 [Bacteroides nordii]|uniref:Uncharacterized protein n=1 Tax=Bacteroides nordii TaxID=291645 RepID=A0A413VAI6_9BACE|nr:hypothetical protein DW888_18675 [Bacteroides nordii]